MPAHEADPGDRAVCVQLFDFSNRGFESHGGHGYLSLVCCLGSGLWDRQATRSDVFCSERVSN